MKRNFFFFSSNPIESARFSVLLVSLILLSTVVSHAQSFERGNSSELQGLTKLYINAGTDTERRNLIANAIEEAKIPGLVIVDSREKAEIIMRFGGRETEVLQNITTNPVPGSDPALGVDWTITTVERRTVRSGQGLVFIKGKDIKTPRIVMMFNSAQDSAFEKRPAVKFAQKFVKAYKEANKSGLDIKE